MRRYVKVGRVAAQHDDGGHYNGPQSYGRWVRVVTETPDGYEMLTPEQNRGTISPPFAAEEAEVLAAAFGGLDIIWD